jgi:hypothetical protein
MATNTTFLPRACCRWVKRADHFLAEQAVGRAQIGLAGTVADRTGLRLAPREALARQLRDRVEEEGLVAVELRRVAKLLDDVVVVRLRERALRRQRLVRAREEHEEVAALGPRCRADGVARPVGHGQIARLDVEEQRGGGVEVFEPGGLADAGLAQHQQLHALALGHALCAEMMGRDITRPPSTVRRRQDSRGSGSRCGRCASTAWPRPMLHRPRSVPIRRGRCGTASRCCQHLVRGLG